ncbi:uncharacterized protein SPAPADRAFT_61465, partial [Spathaspora passalidarum NRRL Y-27907]
MVDLSESTKSGFHEYDKSVNKPSYDETVGSILPSYSMFTNTIRMNATVPENEERDDNPPPNYQDTPSITSDDHGTSLSSSSHAQLSLGASDSANTRSTTTEEDDDLISSLNNNFIIADENTHAWQETIL